jgi:hypothetical protein
MILRKTFVAILLFAAASVAHGETSPVASACPEGNLLAGRSPHRWLDLSGPPARLTDGAVGPEGAFWSSPPAVALLTDAASVDFDLGETRVLRAAWLQADANDTYSIFGSLDGESWHPLAQVESVLATQGHGLRARTVALPSAEVRWIRIGEPRGDGAYSLAEVQVFCKVPERFPPPVRIEAAEMAQAPAREAPFWSDTTSARWELVLAAAMLWLLASRRRISERGWQALALLAFATYFNFGSFHFGNYVHGWDVFHYYVGAKYFPELGYERLYECVAIADAEDGLRRRVELRKLTDLRTNELITASSVLADPMRCKSHFSDERWFSFKADVAYFRSHENPKRWDETQTDHGFNGTPVWTIAGFVLANLAPASDRSILFVTLLDPAYLAAALWLVRRAFGWRTAALAMLVFATNFPSRFYWTGGAFLRWDWIFYTVAAIACLKLDRPFLGGLAFGYAALLRIFPGLLVAGPALALGWHVLRTRRLEPNYVRFFAGAAVAGVLFMTLSLPIAGPGGYREFVQNSVKHTATPLTNYMGLRTLVAYRPSEVGRHLRTDRDVDPWGKWKSARLGAFEQAKPVFYVLFAGYLALLAFAVRDRPAWLAAALGATAPAFAIELTSYYYAFLLAVALATHEREDVPNILFAVTAATGVIAWAPLPFLPTWWDEQYTAMSLVTVIGLTALLFRFALPSRGATGLSKPANAAKNVASRKKGGGSR